MAFQLLINEVDYTDNFVLSSVRINEGLQANGQSMSGIVQLSGALARPIGGNTIRLFRDSTLEFAGRIVVSEQTQPTSAHALLFHYQLECVDWTADLDQTFQQVQYDPGQYAGDIVKALVALVGRGFTTTNVVNGPQIDGIKADIEPLSGIITRIAEAIEHQWYVDYNRDINFFYILDRPAPITSIDFDTDITNYFDLTVAEHVEHVKNAIYLTGATVKSQTQDQIINYADGDTRFWPLNYQPWSQTDITVKVNDVPQTVLLDGVDGSAGDDQAPTSSVYVCIDNWGIRFPDTMPPTLNDKIEVLYNYAFSPVILVEDPISIANMMARENTAIAPSNGRHEFKFDVPDLRVETEDTILDYGTLLLARYSAPSYTLNFKSWTQGWQAGQTFTGVSTTRSLPSTQFYVISVTKAILAKKKDGPATDTPAFEYNIVASSVPFPQ